MSQIIGLLDNIFIFIIICTPRAPHYLSVVEQPSAKGFGWSNQKFQSFVFNFSMFQVEGNITPTNINFNKLEVLKLATFQIYQYETYPMHYNSEICDFYKILVFQLSMATFFYRVANLQYFLMVYLSGLNIQYHFVMNCKSCILNRIIKNKVSCF